MASATMFQTGYNMLQVGCVRLPFLIAQVNAVSCVGELAFRAARAALTGIQQGIASFSEASSSDKSSTPSTKTKQQQRTRAYDLMTMLRPYANMDIRLLATTTVVCAVVGMLGTAVVAAAFGPPPAIYNRGLSILGNLRFVDDVHPFVSYAASFVR